MSRALRFMDDGWIVTRLTFGQATLEYFLRLLSRYYESLWASSEVILLVTLSGFIKSTVAFKNLLK